MNIYDLAELDEATALRLARETLDRFPDLRRLYDHAFLLKLVRRRATLDNFLLLQLVRTEDEFALGFWANIVDDLRLLEAEGSWLKFKHKLRRQDYFGLESARTELTLPAWMKRLGFAVTLEPLTRNGKGCDFSAGTEPKIWWEIKAVRDADFILKDERANRIIQQRFRRIPEPYILALQPSDVSLHDAPKAAKSIRKAITHFYNAGGDPPKIFESNGLVLEVSGRTKREFGYLGTTSTGLLRFEKENTIHVLRSISSAVSQLPNDGANVIVIDATAADWIDDEDVISACFGEEALYVRQRELISVREPGGAFTPDQRTRISAVALYSRHPSLGEQPFEMSIFHNPFARTSLPTEMLDFEGVKQFRRVELGHGKYRLDEVGDRAAKGNLK